MMSKLEKELSEDEQKRKQVHQQWQNLSVQLAKGQQAQRYRKKIEELNINDEIKDKFETVQGHFRASVNQIYDKYSTNDIIETKDLTLVMNEVKQNIIVSQSKIRGELEAIINDSVVGMAEAIFEAYRKQILEIMSANQLNITDFKFDISTDIMSMSLPEVNQVIEKYTEEQIRTEQVGVRIVDTGSWWWPPDWFRDNKKEEIVWEDRRYLVAEVKKVVESYIRPITDNMFENQKKVQAATLNQIEDFKKNFIHIAARKPQPQVGEEAPLLSFRIDYQ